MNENDIKVGYVYHIKDEYFNIAKDNKLMKNKGGAYRPVYFGIKDLKTNLLWVVPMSTQAEKYQWLIDKDMKKYGECLKIIVGEYNGKNNAFLFQNMFPVLPKYISHIHTLVGVPVPVSSDLQIQIDRNFREVRRLHKLGVKLIFPDIGRLEKLMLSERDRDQV
jgi:hypothetical protein